MSSRTKVSKQVKVTQGKSTITFELLDKGLVVEHSGGATEYFKFTLKPPAMDALRELLGLQQPQVIPGKPLTLTPKEFDERFKDAQPKPEDASEDGGLGRAADGVEAGMD